MKMSASKEAINTRKLHWESHGKVGNSDLYIVGGFEVTDCPEYKVKDERFVVYLNPGMAMRGTREEIEGLINDRTARKQ